MWPDSIGCLFGGLGHLSRLGRCLGSRNCVEVWAGLLLERGLLDGLALDLYCLLSDVVYPLVFLDYGLDRSIFICEERGGKVWAGLFFWRGDC